LSKKVARVFIGGDWDADGLVSTALLVYAQEKLSAYPVQAPSIVIKKPVDPDSLRFLLTELSGVFDYAVFLDIPCTQKFIATLTLLKKHFSIGRIMYIDHHITSIQNKDKLSGIADEVYVDKDKPTASIVYKLLREKGVTVHARLAKFVELVEYMDSGKKIPSDLMKLFEIAKLIAKALTIKRDRELWVKIVDWLASPTPLPSPLEESIFKNLKSIVEERDRVLNEVATDLALSAVRIGPFRFVDARSKWKYRGVSALASKLYSILKAPVILWVASGKDYTLLVIKASRGKAYRLAKILVAEGVALDVAGHPNLAIAKIPGSVTAELLRERIQKAVYYV